MKRSKIKLFADDTLNWIVADVDELPQKVIELNQDLHQLSMFFEARKMSLNVNKIKFMIISKRNIQNLHVVPMINGQDIERVFEMKYLGVIIDPKLKFDANLEYVKKKMAKKHTFYNVTNTSQISHKSSCGLL